MAQINKSEAADNQGQSLRHSTSSRRSRNKLIVPFRAIGHVCGTLPVTILNRGSAFFAISSLESTFQIYDVCALSLNY